MYLAVDIGGTKTLLASFSEEGECIEQYKFPTSQDYAQFIIDLGKGLKDLKTKQFKAAGIACPGLIDYQNGVVRSGGGNLDWTNAPITKDISNQIQAIAFVQNDAKVSTLGEASLLKDEFRSVLYLSISTGIGVGLAYDCKLDLGVIHMEAGLMYLDQPDGNPMMWERFASGKAFSEKYSKRASDIDDAETWTAICKNFAKGLRVLMAVIQPEVMVFGGGVGAHFDKYQNILAAELEKFTHPAVPMPALRKAQRAEEAGIYGCYTLIQGMRQNIK